MSDKQKGEGVSKPVAYDQLLSHLLHVGETLLGETQGVFDRLSQEIALVTHEQVQLILQQETSEQPPPPQPRFRRQTISPRLSPGQSSLFWHVSVAGCSTPSR